MSTARLLWFFLWRTSLSNAVLAGVALMLIQVTLLVLVLVYTFLFDDMSVLADHALAGIFWFTAIGMVFGVMGMLFGSVLGVLCGGVLFYITRFLFRDHPQDLPRYKRVSGWTCAGATVIALFVDWFLNGYPYIWEFAFWRFLGNSENVTPFNLFDAVYLVVAPTLIFSTIALLSGRRVAAQYVDRVFPLGEDGST